MVDVQLLNGRPHFSILFRRVSSSASEIFLSSLGEFRPIHDCGYGRSSKQCNGWATNSTFRLQRVVSGIGSDRVCCGQFALFQGSGNPSWQASE